MACTDYVKLQYVYVAYLSYPSSLHVPIMAYVTILNFGDLWWTLPNQMFMSIYSIQCSTICFFISFLQTQLLLKRSSLVICSKLFKGKNLKSKDMSWRFFFFQNEISFNLLCPDRFLAITSNLTKLKWSS